MLKVEGRFERINHYITRNYLAVNKEKYEEVTKSLYLTKKVTRKNLDFLLDYNKKSKRIFNILPDVKISDETGITVYMNDKGKLKVQKCSYSYVDIPVIW